jgi:hypothetical protein
MLLLFGWWLVSSDPPRDGGSDRLVDHLAVAIAAFVLGYLASSVATWRRNWRGLAAVRQFSPLDEIVGNRVKRAVSRTAGRILSRMGTKSRETIYGASVRTAAERASKARREADRPGVPSSPGPITSALVREKGLSQSFVKTNVMSRNFSSGRSLAFCCI